MIQPEHIFIFTGPTLLPERAAKELDAVYLPPVKLGDVYRISELFSPRIIGIIDGYFNQVPAVWHKEILHVMSQGVRVYGAASMGALRAAELDQLGMLGCGEIYRAYQRGVLEPFTEEVFEDDDEVAVIHGPAELGYPAISDAMVNIRFTLANAMQQAVIDLSIGHQLIKTAKNLFYAQRNYADILKIARQKGLPVSQLDNLQTWLKQHLINQKQRDAISLLETIRDDCRDAAIPATIDEKPFEHTGQWQTAIDEINRSHHIKHPALDELRLKGADYFTQLEQAHTTAIPARKQHARLKPLELTALHASPEKLNQRLSAHWQQKQVATDSGATLHTLDEQRLLAYLTQTDALVALQHRAEDKLKTIAQLQQKPDPESLSELDRLQLCDWHFSTQLGTQMPDRPHEYAQKLGLDDEDAFYVMLLSEYLYLHSIQKRNDDGPAHQN